MGRSKGTGLSGCTTFLLNPVSMVRRSTPAVPILLILAAATIAHLPVPARAQRHPVLQRAKQEYANQSHDKVIALVRPLVEPRSVLPTERDEAEAYELLGLSYWWLKKYSEAESAFLILLSIRPNHVLNPVVHSAGVIKYFKKVKEKFRRKPSELRLRQQEELRKCQKSAAACRAELGRMKRKFGFKEIHTRTIRPRWLAVIPFGVGQFLNNQRTKGWVFLSVEALLAATNITAYVLLQTDWARNSKKVTGFVDRTTTQRARALQILQIASGSMLIITMGVGIADALLNWKPVKTQVKKIPLTEPRSGSLRIWPAVGPSAGTLNVSFDF